MYTAASSFAAIARNDCPCSEIVNLFKSGAYGTGKYNNSKLAPVEFDTMARRQSK
jgi:hypothetical protein